MGCIPSYGGNGNGRNVSCSKPSLHCRKRPRKGALHKWLTRSTSDATHVALYKCAEAWFRGNIRDFIYVNTIIGACRLHFISIARSHSWTCAGKMVSSSTCERQKRFK